MATLFLDKVDAAPILTEKFNYPFENWLSVSISVLNEDIQKIQDSFNLLKVQSYTSAEITAMFAGGDLENGMILYDSDLDVYVGVQADALVKFTTAAYP